MNKRRFEVMILLAVLSRTVIIETRVWKKIIGFSSESVLKTGFNTRNRFPEPERWASKLRTDSGTGTGSSQCVANFRHLSHYALTHILLKYIQITCLFYCILFWAFILLKIENLRPQAHIIIVLFKCVCVRVVKLSKTLLK